MIHLRSITLLRERVPQWDAFPFSVPTIRSLETFNLAGDVTILVGENGSGKSTLLEALAWCVESVVAGSASLETDETLQHVRPLGERLRPAWNKRTRRGFFLRAEDFFGLVKRTRADVTVYQDLANKVREENAHLPEGELNRILGPFVGTVRSMQTRYGDDMDARSHGEQFLEFFQSRLVPGGLYLLDEPEAPLSPMRQLALISLIKQAVEEHRSQFVIATHSPVLMAYPGASISSFDEAPIEEVAYGELEHVKMLRDFLNNPEVFLRHL